jgi:phosphatidate cytidylyltransferase
MLKSRVLTAIILLLIIVSLIWLLKTPVFAVIVSIFFIISAWEWARLVGLISIFWRFGYVILVILLLFTAYFLSPLPWLYTAFILWLWAAAAIISYQQGGGLLGFQNPWVKGLTGLVMLVACWRSLVVLQAASPWLLLGCLSVCWLADTGAYFAGRRWGAHALAERISPKKTWEGFWGGILLTIATLAVATLFAPISPLQRGLFIIVIAVCALFSVIGDLFLSLLKRQAGVKDSGNILPGHGGLLDRVDSTICVASIFALGFLLLKFPH